jgi:hypothetical protein
MVVERSMDPGWLSNAYLAWDEGSREAFFVDSGAPPLPDLEFIHESEHLNLSVFPAVADYRRSRPLAPTWHRLASLWHDLVQRGRARAESRVQSVSLDAVSASLRRLRAQSGRRAARMSRR